MKKLIHTLIIMLTLAALVMASPLTTFAAEFEDYYEELSELYGDVNNDWLITIKDVTETQKYLAKYIEFSEDALHYADVDGNGEVTISDVTTIQKYLAEIIVGFPVNEVEAGAYAFVDKPVDVQFASDDEFIISLLIKEDGFYDLTLTPSEGYDIEFEAYEYTEVYPDIFYSDYDGETASCYGYFVSGTYWITIRTWGEDNVVATFTATESDSEPPFVMEEAEELKVDDRITVPAGEGKYVYKVDLETIRYTGDFYSVYTEGEETIAAITCYSELYAVRNDAMLLDDGKNVMLYVSDDYESNWMYVVVEAFEGSGEFTICCDSFIETYKESATALEPDKAAEISFSTIDEEFTSYFANGTYKFAPEKDGYYSFTYEFDNPVTIIHTLTNFDYDYNEMIPFIRDAEGTQVMDVRYLSAGVTYYLDFMAEAEELTEMSLTVSISSEGEYNQVREEDEDWLDDTPFGEAVYEEVKLGEIVEVDLTTPNNSTGFYTFTAEEDCEIVLFSENSVDAYMEIYSADGEFLYAGDDLYGLDSKDFATKGKMSAGETCYIHLLSFADAGDSYSFFIIDADNYIPMA